MRPPGPLRCTECQISCTAATVTLAPPTGLSCVVWVLQDGDDPVFVPFGLGSSWSAHERVDLGIELSRPYLLGRPGNRSIANRTPAQVGSQHRELVLRVAVRLWAA